MSILRKSGRRKIHEPDLIQYANAYPGSVFFVAGFAVAAAAGNSRETFAVRPETRVEKAQQARAEAAREKDEVKRWARGQRGMMRQDGGRRLLEAMALRNGRPLFYSTFNDDAAVSTAAAFVRSTPPFDVAGAEVTVGIWDGGLIMNDHQEVAGRVSVGDSGAAVHYHATHVGGTIGAAGIVARAEGMAPSAVLESYD
jgi:hypothetical protein